MGLKASNSQSSLKHQKDPILQTIFFHLLIPEFQKIGKFVWNYSLFLIPFFISLHSVFARALLFFSRVLGVFHMICCQTYRKVIESLKKSQLSEFARKIWLSCCWIYIFVRSTWKNKSAFRVVFISSTFISLLLCSRNLCALCNCANCVLAFYSASQDYSKKLQVPYLQPSKIHMHNLYSILIPFYENQDVKLGGRTVWWKNFK